MKRKLRNILVVVLLTLPCAEIAVRILGWKPYKNSDYAVEVTPKYWLSGDSLLGFLPNTGSYDITLNDAIHFSVTHDASNRRTIVAPKGEDTVIVFGCSFTYGYGVNDDDIFVNQLQKHFPEQHYINYAVPGYGTAQALIQLQTLIDKGKIPDKAMLVFSEVHPERNALAKSYRQALKIGFSHSNEAVEDIMKNARIPYRVLGSESMKFCEWETLYSHWPGRESFALVHALQTTFQRGMEEEAMVAITAEMLDDFVALCIENKIEPIVVNLDDRKFNDHYPDITKEKTTLIHVGFDFHDPKITLYPHDTHPNIQGHTEISKKIQIALEGAEDE